MELEITLEQSDWVAFQRHVEKQLLKTTKKWYDGFWFNAVIWLFITLALLAALDTISGAIHWPSVAFTALFFALFMLLYWIQMWRLRRAFVPSKDGSVVGHHSYIIERDGIRMKGDGYEGFNSWRRIQKLERADGIILVYLDRIAAIILPESQLEDPDGVFDVINRHLGET